jgi:UDP-N-acetylglucosamine 1-carboxyvinyltransferase
MTDQFIIEGLAGAKSLEGEIPVRGAKNAIIKSFAASILFEDDVKLENVPDIEDVSRMRELLMALGAQVTPHGDRAYTISTSGVKEADLDDTIARRLRASIVLSGPLLARFGRVSFPHPGGDIIGARPINFFLDGFKRMGAEVILEGDRYRVTAPGGLVGAEIFFMFISVTATETLMMAAVGAKGKTVLKNAAMEPEIVELANYLNRCGAKISGAGTPTIEIEGTGMLRARGNVWSTIPDRIETGTFLLLGALAARELTITDCDPAHVEMLVALLRESGTEIELLPSAIKVRGNGKPTCLQVRTHEYPGFATDMQPPMVAYLTQAEGESTMFEAIWTGRLQYVKELVRMGANIELLNNQQLVIKGPTALVGAELESPDIRAGLAYLMAGALASGTSVVKNIYHIDRGYEHIEERLQKVGLDIKRQTA